ncbi:MAG: hypothetical protein JRH13_03960 [Deltaproteobacteria bacterium]|nr:hypothetical protein [Deltaproteobacteria bacterium]MBW2128499.1 hypothetical protein [Deltaproteobacteria bacterium]MBW2303642.1 hypothetical protein [Deltaproteobacteria bacterium]
MQQGPSFEKAAERVRLAIEHRVPDRIPKGELIIDPAVIREECPESKTVGFEEELEFVKRLGLDLVCISPVYPNGTGALPAPGETGWPHLDQWTGKTDLFTFAILDGLFGWGLRILGFKELILLPRRSASKLFVFAKEVEKLNRYLTGRLAGQGVDGIIFADDIAYTRGLMTDPETFRTFFLPCLENQVEEAVRRGLVPFFHSDGRYEEIIPDLLAIGIKGIHCIDPQSGMEIRRIKDRWGKELCLWGHLVPGDLGLLANRADLGEWFESLDYLGSGGGLILGTTSGLFPGVDIESLKQLYRYRLP